jgi:hypothetical protein
MLYTMGKAEEWAKDILFLYYAHIRMPNMYYVLVVLDWLECRYSVLD